jgi:hypothetical protein
MDPKQNKLDHLKRRQRQLQATLQELRYQRGRVVKEINQLEYERQKAAKYIGKPPLARREVRLAELRAEDQALLTQFEALQRRVEAAGQVAGAVETFLSQEAAHV